MAVIRVTKDFLAWLEKNGLTLRDIESPPVAWGYIVLYEKEREIRNAS